MKAIQWIISALVAVVIIAAAVGGGVYFTRLKSIHSIRKLTDYENYNLYRMDIDYAYDLDRLIDRGITDNQSMINAILAEALPYPLDTLTHGMGSKRSQAEATKLVPFIEEMNREMLTVKGLKGDYTLYIDGERIGTWSGKQLGEGINLAELQTPQYRQAMEVMHLNEYRWEIERNFRDYAWVQYDFFQNKGLLDANDAHAVSVLDAEKGKNIWLQIHRENYAKLMLPHVREARAQQMELLVETIYEINKPQTRKVVLRPN